MNRFWKQLFCLFVLIVTPLMAAKNAKNAKQLAVLSIFRDEAPYMKEWIEYYRMMGVSKFFLYNHLSTDNFAEVLNPYIKQGIVELTDWPYDYEANDTHKWRQIQLNAYNDALPRIKKEKFEWLALIDLDEFFVPVKHKSLISYLKDRCADPKIPGIAGRWVMFGTSHVAMIPPDKTMIEMLIRNDGETALTISKQTVYNTGHYKSIGRVKHITRIPSPHYFSYDKNTFFLEDFDYLQINHYFWRDEHYFYNKKNPSRIARGYHPSTPNGGNQVIEPLGLPILRFVPELRARLGLPN